MVVRPSVAVVALPQDPQAHAVRLVLEALGARVVDLPLHQLESGWPLSFTPGGATRLGRRLVAPVGAAYVKSLPGAYPPITQGKDGTPMVLGRWMVPFMWAREREAAAHALLLAWQARGVALLNPPGTGGWAQNKPYQLALAAGLGLRTPATCITNDPAEARAFVRRVGRAIAKPVTGGALTTPVARGQNFDAIGAAPVLLQQRVDGDDVRLYLLEGRVLSCRAVVLPEGPVLDFRGSAAYQGGRASYAPVALPAHVVKQAAAWARACGLTLAGLDLKRTARGQYVFLEANSSPIWLDQEIKSGDPISAWVAHWLYARARGVQAPHF